MTTFQISDYKTNATIRDGALLVGDANGQLDAFGRKRVSQAETLFDSKQLHDSAPLFFDNAISGGTVAHSTTNAETVMTVSNNNDYVIRQTKMRFNYQPGKSQLFFYTFVLNPTANTVKRVGSFTGSTTAPHNPTTGFFLEADGTTVNLVVMKNGSANRVPQSQWNADVMSGVGGTKNPSGYNVDWSKAQIMMVDMEWLGVGELRFWLVNNHRLLHVHTFLHSNTVSSVYMESPNLPVRYETRSTGGSSTLQHICCSVNSEAGSQALGSIRTIDMGITPNSITTTEEVLIAIRLKSTHLDSSVGLRSIGLLDTSNGNVKWSVQLNPTLGGTALTWSDLTNGSVQYSTTQGATITSAGTVLYSGYASSKLDTLNLGLENSIRLGSKVDGTRDIIVLTAQRLTAGSDDVLASLTFRELF